MYRFLKAIILFSVGIVFYEVLDLLQCNKGASLGETNVLVLAQTVQPKIWIPLACGFSGMLFGLTIPYLDSKYGYHGVAHNREWTSVIRCLALFMGISHATVKINFTSPYQLSFSMAAMALGLWYVFDRSRVGLLLALLGTVVAVLVSQLIIITGYDRSHDPRMHIWFPCIYFSAVVTSGLIGRQLTWHEGRKTKVD